LDSQTNYPPHNIDPRNKGFAWILQYIKAAWTDSQGYLAGKSLFFGQSKYDEIRQYAMGKQSINKYKKILLADETDDKSWLSISWDVPSFLTKFREIAIAKLNQKQFDLQAYAVDPLARSEEDAKFNEMKVKVLMREQALAMQSELADTPVLAPTQGEPEDMEQLLMQKEFGYKHVMGMEAELGIQLVFGQNNIEEKRKRTIENQVDYGIGGYTTWIDHNGNTKFRELNPRNLVLSYCEKNDFSDLVHWGEAIELPVVDLVPYFDKKQMDDICVNVAGKWGNPSTYRAAQGATNPDWSRFKVLVLDFKFLSWNETVYKDEVDGRGNTRFGKTNYDDKKYLSVNKNGLLAEYTMPTDVETTSGGSPTAKYISTNVKVVYKGKWLIGTDLMYDWGLQENMSRKSSTWTDTNLDIQLYAWNFNQMQFTGITERLIPFEDKACLAWFRLQNMANRLIPYLINIDLTTIESTGFGKGGANMKPAELIDFVFSTFVVPYRSTDLLSSNPNYKPVTIEATGQLAAFGQLYEELAHTIEMMRQVTGLNEATDASTVNAKTLNGATQAMMESTNNALYLVSNADKQLMVRLADSIVTKIQIAVGLGKVEGYAKALGSDTVNFIKINPDISLYELGIFIEDAPTQQQREMLWQDISIKESQGLLSIEDKVMIMSVRNLKQAAMMLAYKIKKRKEEQQQFELQKIQENNQGQQQMLMTAEQMKQQTLQMQAQLDIQRITTEKQWEFEIEKMKKMMDFEGETVQADARTIGHQIQADAKVYASQIAAEGGLIKQQIQNEKPQPKSKSK